MQTDERLSSPGQQIPVQLPEIVARNVGAEIKKLHALPAVSGTVTTGRFSEGRSLNSKHQPIEPVQIVRIERQLVHYSTQSLDNLVENCVGSDAFRFGLE